MTQFVLGFKVDWQLLVWVKVLLAGEIPMFVMLTAAAPSLYSVMLWEVVVPGICAGKARLLGISVIALAAPTPVSAMVWLGLPGSLSLSVTVPVRVPAAVGLKATVIVQFRPALSVLGQVLLSGKSPLLLLMLAKVTE